MRREPMLVSIKSLSNGPAVTAFTGMVTKVGLAYITVDVGPGKSKKLIRLGKNRFNRSVTDAVFEGALITFNVKNGKVIHMGYSSQQRLL